MTVSNREQVKSKFTVSENLTTGGIIVKQRTFGLRKRSDSFRRFTSRILSKIQRLYRAI